MDNQKVQPSQQTTPPQVEPVTLELLPEAVRLHLNSDETIQTFLNLEKEYRLTPEKSRAMPLITGLIVEGSMQPKDAVEALTIALGVSTEQAKNIAGVIKDKVFNPIAGALLLISGIDIELIPGKSAKDAKDAPGLADELAPYFAAQPEQTKEGLKKSSASELEPLVVSPVKQPSQPGMVLPPTRQPLRPMNDVVAPQPAPKPEAKPEPVKMTAAPRPFMLHEEKPVAPQEQKPIKLESGFSFNPGPTQAVHQPVKPVAAKLGASFEEILAPQKPVVNPTAKTTETPKVVHYTSLCTPLEAENNE